MKCLSTYSSEVKVLHVLIDGFIVTHRVLALILMNISHQNQTGFFLSLSSTVVFSLALSDTRPADRSVCFGYRSDTLSETGVKMQTGYLKCKNIATSHFCFTDSQIIRILVHTGWRQTRRSVSSSPAAFSQSINCWSKMRIQLFNLRTGRRIISWLCLVQTKQKGSRLNVSLQHQWQQPNNNSLCHSDPSRRAARLQGN